MTGKLRVPTVGTACSSTSEAAEPSAQAGNFGEGGSCKKKGLFFRKK